MDDKELHREQRAAWVRMWIMRAAVAVVVLALLFAAWAAGLLNGDDGPGLNPGLERVFNHTVSPNLDGTWETMSTDDVLITLELEEAEAGFVSGKLTLTSFATGQMQEATVPVVGRRNGNDIHLTVKTRDGLDYGTMDGTVYRDRLELHAVLEGEDKGTADFTRPGKP